MMTRIFCVFVCVLAFLDSISAQVTQTDNTKIITFSPCEFCSPISTGFCCQFGQGCCPQYNKCRPSMACRSKTTCASSNCLLGCCRFDDGRCCPWEHAVLISAPWFGAVTIPPPGMNGTF